MGVVLPDFDDMINFDDLQNEQEIATKCSLTKYIVLSWEKRYIFSTKKIYCLT